MRIIRGIALYISFAVLVFAVFYCLSVALMYAYGHLVKPLPIEQPRVQQIDNVDICREVESGAVRARTTNACPPVFDTPEVNFNYQMQPFGVGEEDDLTAVQLVQPAGYSNQTTRHYFYLQGSQEVVQGAI